MAYPGCVYNLTTGRIANIFDVPSVAYALGQVRTGFDVFAGAFDQSLDYIDVGVSPDERAVRTSMGATWDTQTIDADGVDSATLSGLPEGVTVFVDGVDVGTVGVDGLFVFTATTPGDYEIVIDEVIYLRDEWTIDAT